MHESCIGDVTAVQNVLAGAIPCTEWLERPENVTVCSMSAGVADEDSIVSSLLGPKVLLDIHLISFLGRMTTTPGAYRAILLETIKYRHKY